MRAVVVVVVVGLSLLIGIVANNRVQAREAVGVFLYDAVKDGAMCLDGSAPAYYYEKGIGSGEKKWFVWHKGGGWCSSFEQCVVRSKTDLGSSKYYPPTSDLNEVEGYFSDEEKVNPMMHNWNKVEIMYCDGGSYAGNSSATFNGTTLYYRGKLILEAIRNDLLAKGLKDATDVVISGCSAGGLAVYLHVDWWRESLPERTYVVGLPDSGFFLDYESGKQFPTRMNWTFVNQKVESGVNQRCIEFYRPTNQTWKCFFAQYTAPHIQTPIFPLQSQHDSYQILSILGTKNVIEVNQYGHNLTQLIYQTVITDHNNNAAASKKNGMFLDSCYHHCGAWGEITIDGKNQAEAFKQWFESNDHNPKNNFHFQNKPYPCLDCCTEPPQQTDVLEATLQY